MNRIHTGKMCVLAFSAGLRVTDVVHLSSLDPVAEGGGRLVYFHPDFPDCLLKVGKTKSPGTTRERVQGFIARRLETFGARDLRQEIKAYVNARLQQGREAGSFPAANFYGFVETDRGVAIAVERIARTGEIMGLHLKDLAGKEEELPDHHLSLLNDFSKQLFSWRLRVRDLNPKNIVLGERNGRERLFLVDGLGDMTAIPINTWSDTANRIELNRRLSMLAESLQLKWDGAACAFSRGSARYARLASLKVLAWWIWVCGTVPLEVMAV